MKTLTITEGRGRLGYWLKKAIEGTDVGFVFEEEKLLALRPGWKSHRMIISCMNTA